MFTLKHCSIVALEALMACRLRKPLYWVLKASEKKTISTNRTLCKHFFLTCFCWLRCISSNCVLSISNTIGANKISEVVNKTHVALLEKLYAFLAPDSALLVAIYVKLRTDSGNISVKPHSRSAKVSSGWKKWGYAIFLTSKKPQYNVLIIHHTLDY